LVKLEASAEMFGDITARVLIIEEGAVLHGVCDVSGEETIVLPEIHRPVKVKKAVG